MPKLSAAQRRLVEAMLKHNASLLVYAGNVHMRYMMCFPDGMATKMHHATGRTLLERFPDLFDKHETTLGKYVHSLNRALAEEMMGGQDVRSR